MIECEAGAVHAGELDVCGKPAVTYADPAPWRDEYGDIPPWPICAYHAHMGTPLPLHLHPKEDDRGRP